MRDPLQAALKVAGSGLEAQSARLRVISENIANAQSLGATPGSMPYARKTITFDDEIDRASGAALVRVKSVGVDPTRFKTEYDPTSPAADANGYVKAPNVDLLVELADMKEANRNYEANLQVAKQSAAMLTSTLNLLHE
jgi:flagellar basal-body rod protein FlgC